MADGNLFSGLEKLGLGKLSDMNLYEEENEKAKDATDTVKNAHEERKTKEEEVLYDKGYSCPVCDNEFKAKVVKTGKVRMAGSDIDLRPKYEDVDPLKYDAIVCPKCGYASLARFFSHISEQQIKLIRAGITPSFKGIDDQSGTYSYDNAITRHELALANSVVKKGKASEKAYTCLKIAWLKRGKIENLDRDVKDREKTIAAAKAEEKAYIAKAYEGFKVAMSKESFPICGMDEWTFVYLVAELAYECGDYSNAMKLLSDVVSSRAAIPKLKEKARELRILMQNKA